MPVCDFVAIRKMMLGQYNLYEGVRGRRRPVPGIICGKYSSSFDCEESG